MIAVPSQPYSWRCFITKLVNDSVSSTIKRVPKMSWMEAARAVVKGLFWVFEGARMSRHILFLFIVGDYMYRKSPPLSGIYCLSIPTPCFDTLLVDRAPVHVLATCRFGRFGSSSWPSLASSPRSGCSVFTTDISVVIYYRICSPTDPRLGALAQSRKSSSTNFQDHRRTIHSSRK